MVSGASQLHVLGFHGKELTQGWAVGTRGHVLPFRPLGTPWARAKTLSGPDMAQCRLRSATPRAPAA